RIEQRIEAARLNRAGGFDLVAQQPRQIDVEPRRVAVSAGIIERRIIQIGEETDGLHLAQIGPLRPAPWIPEAGHNDRLSRSGRDRSCRTLGLVSGSTRSAALAAAVLRQRGQRQHTDQSAYQQRHEPHGCIGGRAVTTRLWSGGRHWQRSKRPYCAALSICPGPLSGALRKSRGGYAGICRPTFSACKQGAVARTHGSWQIIGHIRQQPTTGEKREMPWSKVTDIAYGRLRSPDLDVQEEFLTNFGMKKVERTANALYMRGSDPAHHIHITEKGDPKF